MNRVEKHKIKKDNECFDFLLDQMKIAKYIANSATFIIRQNYFFNKVKNNKGVFVSKFIEYNKMDKIIKRDREELYRSLIYAQSVQQILRKIHSNFKSFFKAVNDYNKNPAKYSGRPKLPKYKKNDYDELIITNQNIIQKNNLVKLKGKLSNIKFRMYNIGRIKQILFKYNGTDIDVFIIYDNLKEEIIKEKINIIKNDSSRIISIDLGLNNLVTITNNIGLQPIIVNGKGLKSKNIYYNYKLAQCYKNLANITLKKENYKIYKSNKITKLRNKRNNIMNDYLHKTTKYIINYCINNKIDIIVIGNNKFQKTNKRKTKITGLKNFNQVPIKRLITFLKYKIASLNINLIETEESYTSKTSFLDKESPVKHDIYLGKRVKRGLFKRPCGKLVNADVNGSLQILSKVISVKLLDDLREIVSGKGYVLNPVKISF
jgi:transposase, IS605 orfB family